MSIVARLPLQQTHQPATAAELAEVVRDAHAQRTPLYPLGGGTSLEMGLAATAPGDGLSLAGLTRTIDYPARDMTITVEAGMTLAELAELLAAERQWLPVEAGQPEQATVGGLLATNFSGPRRYAWGTARDYVIGVSAVDGRGVAFKAGGRVVKNVAGYDFCKLLVGSHGTLAVITQVTLKLKPIPESSGLAVCSFSSWAQAEGLLASLVNTQTTPTAVELLTGPAWAQESLLPALPAGGLGRVALALEGAAAEVDWMCGQLRREWSALDANVEFVDAAPAAELWRQATEFPNADAPLTLQVTVPPSRAVQLCELLHAVDGDASLTVHAGNGVIWARLTNFSTADVTGQLVRRIQPAAAAHGGYVVALRSAGLGDLTRQAVWGLPTAGAELMARVKRQFDPHGILNPGRFVY